MKNPLSPHAARVIVVVLSLFGLCSLCRPADAKVPWNIRFTTNNDIVTDDDINDDFYTFGGRLDVSIDRWTLRFEENAFTDREDSERRFDESYITLGRLVSKSEPGGWYLWLEGGAAWIGEGILGQDVQNDIHELIDSTQIELEYVEFDETKFHGQAEIGRQFQIGRSFSHGPIVSGSWTVDFRTNALAGWRTIWRPSDRFGVDLVVGARHAKAELGLLDRRLEREAVTALVEVELPWNLVMEWSHNRYGTGRDHFALGVSFGPGRSLRRSGNWGEAGNAVP